MVCGGIDDRSAFSCDKNSQHLTSFCSSHAQPHSCSEAALSLLECLEKLPCVTDEKRPVLECLKDEFASDDCRDVRYAYSMCKHSQLNMRTRIRGVRSIIVLFAISTYNDCAFLITNLNKSNVLVAISWIIYTSRPSASHKSCRISTICGNATGCGKFRPIPPFARSWRGEANTTSMISSTLIGTA